MALYVHRRLAHKVTSNTQPKHTHVCEAKQSTYNLVDALLNDADALPHLLDATQVPVVAVTVDTDRHVKLHFTVCIVRLRLTQIPRHTRATQLCPDTSRIRHYNTRGASSVFSTMAPHYNFSPMVS